MRCLTLLCCPPKLTEQVIILWVATSVSLSQLHYLGESRGSPYWVTDYRMETLYPIYRRFNEKGGICCWYFDNNDSCHCCAGWSSWGSYSHHNLGRHFSLHKQQPFQEQVPRCHVVLHGLSVQGLPSQHVSAPGGGFFWNFCSWGRFSCTPLE